MFQHAFLQGYIKIADIVEFAEADDGQHFLILRDWIGFEEDERT